MPSAKKPLVSLLPPLTDLPKVGDPILIAPVEFGPNSSLRPAVVTSWGSEFLSAKLVWGAPAKKFGQPPPSPYRAFRRSDLVSSSGAYYAITPERVEHLRQVGSRCPPALLQAIDVLRPLVAA